MENYPQIFMVAECKSPISSAITIPIKLEGDPLTLSIAF